jgi:NADPH2:quinone reductase
MKYQKVLIAKHGGPEVLRVVDDEVPEPSRGQVRVRVHAAGVSYADLLMREGLHPESWFRGLPLTPGWDVLGVIDRIGEAVTTLQPGQLVAALPIVGSNAEYLCLPEDEWVPIPAGLDAAEALALVFNYITAYQMLHRSARVKTGERVLIHSAAGGIGSALLQLGRLMELKMIGTASGAKCRLLEELGARAIDYRTTDFVYGVRRFPGDGVDVVFDGVGGSYLQRSYSTLLPAGRLIAYGLSGTLVGGRGQLRTTLANLKDWARAFSWNLSPDPRRVILYSVQTLKRRRPEWYRADLIVLFDLLRRGKIKPIIAARLPLAQVRQAHQLLAAGSTVGKIVLINDC